MTDRKAIATIDTEIGTMTIYYNGAGEEMTAERGEHVEEIGYTPKSCEDAADAVHAMYSTGPWCLEWIEEQYECWTSDGKEAPKEQIERQKAFAAATGGCDWRA